MVLLLLCGRVVGRVWVHWWFGARAEGDSAYHCGNDVPMFLCVECGMLYSCESRCSGSV